MYEIRAMGAYTIETANSSKEALELARALRAHGASVLVFDTETGAMYTPDGARK